MATAPAKSEVKYIGVSIDEFLEHGADDLKRMDELKVDKDIRDKYEAFHKSLRAKRLKVRNYVFVYSKFIIVYIEGTF